MSAGKPVRLGWLAVCLFLAGADFTAAVDNIGNRNWGWSIFDAATATLAWLVARPLWRAQR